MVSGEGEKIPSGNSRQDGSFMKEASRVVGALLVFMDDFGCHLHPSICGQAHLTKLTMPQGFSQLHV